MQNYSKDPEISNLEILLEKFLKKKFPDIKFSIEENELDFAEVIRHYGFLGLFINKANDLYNEVFAKDLPIDFWPNENALLDSEPLLRENFESVFVMLSHFTIHALEEYIKYYNKNKNLLVKNTIPLDPIYQEWLSKVYQKKIVIKNMTQV